VLACLIGITPPAAAQGVTTFSPDRSSYQTLGNTGQPAVLLQQTFELRRGQGLGISPAKQQVMSAIWNASQQTGVDYEYLLAKAHIESGLNPDAKARSSSAAGLFQFIEGTWLRSLERYKGQIGGHVAGSSKALAFSNQATRRQQLDGRFDPALASLVAAAYALENGKRLERILGRRATGTELYLAHFLGTGGASRFMSAWKRNPGYAAASIFPRAAQANRSIFYARSGRARSLRDVLEHFDSKLHDAVSLFNLTHRAYDAASDGELSRVPMDKLGDAIHQLHLYSAGTSARSKTQDEAIDRHLSVSIFTRPSVSHSSFKKQNYNNIIEENNSGAIIVPSRRLFALQEQKMVLGGSHRSRASIAPGNMRPPQLSTCNHIRMCYLIDMSTSTITQVRDLIIQGAYTKAGIARAAGLHANTLRDASEPDWNPTTETLTKLQKFLDANDDTPVLVGAEEIIDEARNGRMYILVDDEDRENEGDLIIPAQMATPAAVNFMATHGRGLICLALDKARVNQLGLDPMSRNNKESMQTAFTVSIEAKDGVTTGISAADRARTISVAIDASKGADDIVTPGHVFPLMARDGGTLVRAGHTEAAVDISRLAGLNPSGVICEIMNEDGTMARLDDLIEFARKHSLKIGTIRDLIAYRMRNDHLVERIDESSFESDYGGQWRMITYRNTVSDNQAYVLQKGHVTPDEPTLARVHPISVFDDVLGAPGPRKRTLQRAMGAIGEKGAGVIVILTQRVGQGAKWTPDEEHRNIGIGSQILADLGVQEMVLLSNSRPDLVALEGYGITIAGHQPIPE